MSIIKDSVYQWIKGDKTGTFETIKDESDEWINFKSGSRIAKNLFGEYFVSAKEMEESEFIELKNDSSKNWETSFLEMNPNSDHTLLPKDVKNVKKNLPENHYIKELIIKQKEYEPFKISIDFNVEIPKSKISKILFETYEEDYIKSLTSFVIEQISIESINKMIKDEIKNSIEKSLEQD